MPRLVCVGAVYIDTILTVPHYPLEDEKLRARSISRRRGGNGGNTLEVLSQLVSATEDHSELSLSLVSVLPRHGAPANQQIASSLPGVDLSECLRREDAPEPPSSFIVRSLETGSRTIVSYVGLEEMTTAEFIRASERLRADWYHFEGRITDTVLQCIRHLRASTAAKISVEAEKPSREGLQELVNEADVVFYSKTWATHKGYSDPEVFLRDQARIVKHPHLLFCTWGDQGASVFNRRDGIYKHQPALNLQDSMVVDTIGAGDTFISGILYALIVHEKSWSLDKALEFGNHLAGWKVVQEGFGGLGRRVLELATI